MKKRILILAGGFSREREISLKTARGVFKGIKKKYITKICEPNGNLIKNIRSFRPNVVFNALHGRYGEDGFVQTILESLKIPYQVEAITGAIANAATAYKVGTGIPAGELKVPIRYSHSPSEVLNLQDLEDCTKLLVESVKRIDANFSLERPYKSV